jgi:hypothetical protein
MTKERKDAIATYSALGMIIFGAILTGAGFCVSPVGKIDESVLWVLGQCLLYAGGIFGVTLYTKHRFDEMDKRMAYLVRHPESVEPEEPEQETDADGTAS